MSPTLLLLDPTAPAATQNSRSRALAPQSLQGLTVGFIDNAKPNFEYLVEDLAKLLTEKFGVKRIVKIRKRSATLPADGAALDDLCRQCDLVVTGSGDCGSCSSWSITDNIEVSKRNRLAITVCSTAFANFGRMQATALGQPDVRIAVIPHPFSSRTRDQIYDIAEQCVRDIEALAIRSPA